MKKYRLIKEYPCSPELNAVVRIDTDGFAKLYCPNDRFLINKSFGTHWVTDKNILSFGKK